MLADDGGPTTVLLLDDIPSIGVAGARAQRVALGPSPGQPAAGGDPDRDPGRRDVSRLSLPEFLNLLDAELERARAVVAVYPGWRPEPAARHLRFARCALDTDRVVGVPSQLPPLALSLLADQLAHLAPYLPPGVLAGLAPRLAAETLAGAWVRSVARLAHIPTSLGQHARSYLPGGFAVTATPSPRVVRLAGTAGSGAPAFRPAEPVRLLAASRDGDLGWFRTALLPAVRASRIQFVPPQPLAGGYWGTNRHLEYVAFSSHPDALADAARSVRVRPCRWCGETIAAATCPFCAMTGDFAPQQQAFTAPAATTTPRDVASHSGGGLVPSPTEPEGGPR